MPVVRNNNGDILLWDLAVDGNIPNDFILLSPFNDIENYIPRPPQRAINLFPQAEVNPIPDNGGGLIANNAIPWDNIVAIGGGGGGVQVVAANHVNGDAVNQGGNDVFREAPRLVAVDEGIPVRRPRMFFGERNRVPNEYFPNSGPVIEGTREKYKPAIEIKNPELFPVWAARLEAYGYSNYGARFNNVVDDFKFLYEINPRRYLILNDINNYTIGGIGVSHIQTKFGYGNLFLFNSFVQLSSHAMKVANISPDISFKRLTGSLH